MTRVHGSTAATPGSTPPVSTSSLSDLHNADCRTMLKLVDELQACGLGTMLALPQLVVCGDQSSGKSSVLEAITQVPFPRKENLCTRFATEIVMRTHATGSIRARIIPDGKLPTAAKNKLTTFDRTITDFNEFGQLIEKVTDHMGLPPIAQDETKAEEIKAFSRNVLSIEISGPEYLPLTVVDLPGLIHTATAVQTDEDKDLIHELVQEYLDQERTIVLAVAAASSDIANMMIFSKTRKVDPKGTRTLGIITKMDKLPAGCAMEKTWLKNARNENIPLQLGWYLLKNRSDEDAGISFNERDKSEAEFFDQGSYKAIPKSNKGIASLRARIADVVYEEGKRRLPKIREDAQKKLEEVTDSLKLLGDEHSTLVAQRRLLMKTSVDFQNIVAKASEEHYQHDFFRAPARDVANKADRKLRAITTRLQKDFDCQMIKYGNKKVIPQTKDGAGTNPPSDLLASTQEFDAIKGKQKTITRAEAVKWVIDLHVETQGRPLPGNFDHSLIYHLFHEQSEHWIKIAEEHISKIDKACFALVVAAIEYVAPMSLANNLFELRFDDILERRYQDARKELKTLDEDRKSPVSIYDQTFAGDVQAREQRQLEYQQEARRALEQQRARGYFPAPPDSATITASKALDQLIAVYDHERKSFTRNITHQVIERHMLKGLAENIFSPTIVSEMTDEEVVKLAKEPVKVTDARNELKKQKEILEKSRKAFMKVLNPRSATQDGGGEGEGAEEGSRVRRRLML